MYQRILVATDGSFWAEAAVAYGIVPCRLLRN